MAGATKKKKIVFIFLLRISIKYIFAKKKIFCIIPMKTIDKNVCYLLLYCQSCEMNRTNDAKYSNFRISLLFFLFFFSPGNSSQKHGCRSSLNASCCYQIKARCLPFIMSSVLWGLSFGFNAFHWSPVSVRN